MPSVAHVVGATLARQGIDTVFGLLGSGNLVVTNALVEGGATFYPSRHEAGALGMADGFGRVTGRVAACSVHQGPGLTNTLTALGEAAKSRTPLVVVVGDTPAAAVRSNFRIDQHAAVHAVGALAERVHTPQSAATDAARALYRAQVESKPVVLMMPIDVQVLDAADTIPDPPAPTPRAPAPAQEALIQAAQILEQAKRPLIIAGRGAVRSGAGFALRELADRMGALLATSAVAHGLFHGHPFNIGISGGFATPLAAELIPQADVVLAFGASLNQWTTRHGALIEGAQVIQIDTDPAMLGAGARPATLGIVGDARKTAQGLMSVISQMEGVRMPALAQTIAERTWDAEAYDDAGTDEFVDPRTITKALDAVLPADRQVSVDSGAFSGWPAMHLPVTEAQSWLFCNAFQAVGLALGPAIGAAVAHPEKTTVAAIGDGGAFLSLAELETAARLGLKNLCVLIYDDAAYGAEVHHFGPMGLDISGTQFPDIDIAAIAAAAGCQGIVARAVDDLAPVADWVANPTAPLVIDAKVNPTVCADWLAEAFKGG